MCVGTFHGLSVVLATFHETCGFYSVVTFFRSFFFISYRTIGTYRRLYSIGDKSTVLTGCIMKIFDLANLSYIKIIIIINI